MLKKFAICAIALWGVIGATALANETAVRQAFTVKFPKYKVDSIVKDAGSGLYEVIADGHAFYTDEKVSFVLIGELFDTRAEPPRNLTQETMAKLAAASLAKSAELAVKRVKGNGKRVLYTFEDPNCGYCKELQKELVKVKDVTIYTFLWPILSQDSVEKSKAIWCSKDRGRAWEDAMLKGLAPTAKRDCDTPLATNAQLAQRFGLRGTPALYLANGQQIGGYVPADRIEAALAGR